MVSRKPDYEPAAMMKIRIPMDLKNWLAAVAKSELRPINSEVILALREYRQRREKTKTN